MNTGPISLLSPLFITPSSFARGTPLKLQPIRKKQLEKEMATHSSVLAWRTPGKGFEPLWAAVYGVAQSQTQLK